MAEAPRCVESPEAARRVGGILAERAAVVERTAAQVVVELRLVPRSGGGNQKSGPRADRCRQRCQRSLLVVVVLFVIIVKRSSIKNKAAAEEAVMTSVATDRSSEAARGETHKSHQ